VLMSVHVLKGILPGLGLYLFVTRKQQEVRQAMQIVRWLLTHRDIDLTLLLCRVLAL
jgi:hypothetical protein